MEVVACVVRTLWPQEWAGRGRTLLVSAALLAIARRVLKHVKRRRLRREYESAGKDVVVLHQFVRGRYCPNLSPFALKLEAFFRLANIKYVVDSQTPFGPKGRCPWITINGEEVADSEFILEHLTHRFNLDLDAHIDPKQAAVLEAVRVLADEHLFWCVVVWRYWLDGSVTFLKSQNFSLYLRFAFSFIVPRGMRDRARQHGIGLHTPLEIYQICKKDCETLAGVLGENKFYGGEEPCRADCAVFGQLAQLMWNAPGSQYQALLTEVYPSLASYCLRMKQRIYPDWDTLITSPHL